MQQPRNPDLSGGSWLRRYQPWASTTAQINEPSYLWLDLDPTIDSSLQGTALEKAEAKGFAKAIEVALACKKVLDIYTLTSFIKTSGKTGLHIYVPCRGFTFAEAHTLAFSLADEAHSMIPKLSTRKEAISHRGDAVYIDAGQNDYADTLAAPYCVRPYHQPLVSTPLAWKEVKKGLDRYAFTMDTMQQRLKQKGDLWRKFSDPKMITANTKHLKNL